MRFANITDAQWRSFVADVAEALELLESDRVYEVHCGAGEFLAPLHDAGSVVGGIDPDAQLIARARQLMSAGHWTVGGVSSLDVADKWDVVVACGAFNESWTLDHAGLALERMVAKAGAAVAILAVPNGLAVDERWFVRTLATLGVASVRLADLRIDEHPPGESRFNLIARLR